MNDKIIIYSLLSALLLLFSCAQEETVVPGSASDDCIVFHTSLPDVDVETRSYDNIQMGDLQGGFTVAAHNLEQEPDADGKLSLYFEKVLVTKTEGMGDAFRSDLCRWPDNKDGKEGRLRIYAFYPSLETLKEKSGFNEGMADLESGKEYFLLHDISRTDLFSYRIGNFKINRDISRHVDLVSAVAVGSKTDNLYSGVTLEFGHKLSRIDFKAWSSSPSYKIEIAGVRIGNAMVSTTFNMEGNWIYGSATEKKCVEYIFRKGDTVVTLDGNRYKTAATATSIMGNGGWAMIIPGNQGNDVGRYTGWNKTASKTGVYFSVLMRVIDNTDNQGLILYPYVDGLTINSGVNTSKMNVVYLVVEKGTGLVLKEVYRNRTTRQYYSNKELTVPYSLENDEEIKTDAEIRSYGWAAMPYAPVWDAGKTYTYTLNYTNGVGVQAPDDAAPGKPIITDVQVGVSESEGVWKMVKDYKDEEIDLKKDEDFTQE